MLIDITIENFQCFKGPATLSMVATAGKQHEDHKFKKSGGKSAELLKVAAIYGANGHGKTKFIAGAKFLRDILVHGPLADGQTGAVPFALDEERETEPSTVIVRFNTAGIDYEYGISADATTIRQEWLYALTARREVVLFERARAHLNNREELELGSDYVEVVPEDVNEEDTDGEREFYEFGARLVRGQARRTGKKAKDFLEFVAQGTKRNQPFLSEAVDRNVAPLSDAFDWFLKSLIIVTADAEYTKLYDRVKSDKHFLSYLSKFLSDSGTGVSGIATREKKLDLDAITGLADEEKKDLLENTASDEVVSAESANGRSFGIYKDEDGKLVLITLLSEHTMKSGSTKKFDFNVESAGTKRLIHLAPVLINTEGHNRVFLIDELDRKLHPILAHKLIESFLEINKDSCMSQLVFTTHNTHLLDLQLMRRDEVWFVEKDKSGSVQLYSLANLKVRKDINLEKGYLQGRFGAIPFIGNIADLGWTQQEDCGQP